ncbi:hypothetical protein ACFWIJ_38995 [Streptomyces sp. NPDC127079]|uniref:hypothetical protein n=1 Tax=Streptomyces sp. NPDC127079 TaxID=3347132 RepID=UPI0036519908
MTAPCCCAPTRCAPHFTPLAAAARSAGPAVALIDHHALLASRADEAVRVTGTSGWRGTGAG